MAIPEKTHVQVIYTPPNNDVPHVACLETSAASKNWRLDDSIFRSISLKQVVLQICETTPEYINGTENYTISTVNHVVSRRFSPSSIYEDRGPLRWILDEEGDGTSSVMGKVVKATGDEGEFIEVYARLFQTTVQLQRLEHQRMMQSLRRPVILTQPLPTPPPGQYFPPINNYYGPSPTPTNAGNGPLGPGIPPGARPPTGTFPSRMENANPNSTSNLTSNSNEVAGLGEEILVVETGNRREVFGNTNGTNGNNTNKKGANSRKRIRQNLKENLRIKVTTGKDYAIDNGSSGETDTDEDLPPSSHSAKLIRSSSSHSSVSMSPSPTNIMPGTIVTRNQRTTVELTN